MLLLQGARNLSAASAQTGGKPFRATLFPGDGIGPEIAKAVQHIFEVGKGTLPMVPGRVSFVIEFD